MIYGAFGVAVMITAVDTPEVQRGKSVHKNTTGPVDLKNAQNEHQH